MCVSRSVFLCYVRNMSVHTPQRQLWAPSPNTVAPSCCLDERPTHTFALKIEQWSSEAQALDHAGLELTVAAPKQCNIRIQVVSQVP